MSKNLSEKTNANIILSMQDVLYRHPLYELIDPGSGEKQINLLVIGFSGFGRDFVDLGLQLGQMAEYTVEATVYSYDAEAEIKDYLSTRPDLGRFININGALDDSSSSYGALRILDISEICGSVRADMPAYLDQDAVLGILLDAIDRNRPYNYIFIDYGDDEANYAAAGLFGEQTQGQKDQCPVCCVIRDDGVQYGENGRTAIISGYSAGKKSASLKDAAGLDAEAFRAHLTWLSTVNFDIDEEYRKFMDQDDPYNYISSRAFALSVRYKLYSVGIAFEKEIRISDSGGLLLAKDEYEAARNFSDTVLRTDGKKHDCFNQLVALEHRRWILSMVTQGWTAPRDKLGKLKLQHCVDVGKVKNKAEKTHPCIVTSTEASPLDSPEYKKNNHEKWEKTPIDPALDELDSMSVKLHQLFRKRADEVIKRDPMKSSSITDIESQIGSMDTNIKLYFKQFKYCLSNIINGNIPYTRQYDVYRNDFTKALEYPSGQASGEGKVPDGLEKVIECIHKDLSEVDRDFFPIIEANLYRNYKAYDNDLIENIPYILTWPLKPSVMMAFDDGCHDGARNDKIFADVAAATVLRPSSIHYIYHYDCDSDAVRLCSKVLSVKNYLEKRSIGTRIILTIAYSESLGKKQIKSLESALLEMRSSHEKNCEKETADSFETNAKVAVVIPDPYKCKNTDEVCDRLCREVLNESPDFYDGSTHLFASATANARFYDKLNKLGIPYFEFDRKRKLFTECSGCGYLNFMYDKSFIRIDDMFALMNAGIKYEHKNHFPNFPDNFESLWDIYMGDYCDNDYEKSSADWDSLCESIKNAYCSRLSARGVKVDSSGAAALLNQLERQGFIRKLEFDDNIHPQSAGFIFKSDEVKSVFEKSGEILEIYAYYNILKTGYFDEVASSYMFDWYYGNIENELDLVLTKGFRSIIAECKAVASINQEHYYKLQTISGNFGIGTLAVLIGSIKKNELNDSEPGQKYRGDQLNIITIFKRNEISDIGQTLRSLMQKTF